MASGKGLDFKYPTLKRRETQVAPVFQILASFLIASLATIASTRSEAAQTNSAGRQPFQTAFLEKLPTSAKGIVLVENLREASLLQLRGFAGKGIALLRNETGVFCIKVPLRFVAGDFGGASINTRRTGPVRLVIYSEKIARRLANGQDVVSDMFSVRSGPPMADIDIQSGISEEAGFVLNPGHTFLADLFGTNVHREGC